MTPVLRRNRKSSDRDILRYNRIGMSLAGISTMFGCHPTSVTLRLKSLGVAPADTRRAFMEDIYASMPEDYIEVVADILEEGDDSNKNTIKGYVRDLIVADIEARLASKPAVIDSTNDNTPEPSGTRDDTPVVYQASPRMA